MPSALHKRCRVLCGIVISAGARAAVRAPPMYVNVSDSVC